jgi:hypothetical protein
MINKILLFRLLVGISLFYCLDGSRLSWGANEIVFFKYLPVLLSFSAVLLLLKNFDKFGWIATFLIFYMAIGSIYRIFYYDVSLESSYLGRSFNMLFLLLGILVAKNRQTVLLYLNSSDKIFAFFGILMIFACFLFPFGLYPFGVAYTEKMIQIYHVSIFIPLSVPFFLKKHVTGHQFLIILFLACFAVFLTSKSTAYMLSIFTLCLGLFLYFHERLQARHVKILFYFLIPCVGFIGLNFFINVLADRVTDMEESLYSVRGISSELRLNEFFESPIFGTNFTSSPLLEFGHIIIPSHFDYLDLLSAGGLFWFIPLLALNLFALKNSIFILLTANSSWSKWAFIFVSSSLVIVANPMMSQPRLAFFFWFSLGILINFKVKNN